MIFRTEKHIERAKQHIASGDKARLAYACLELRYALERIAYQKLQLRLENITIEELAVWQAGRVIERLTESVDDNIEKDYTLHMSKTPAYDTRSADDYEYVQIGAHKAVKAKQLSKYWHTLGSFLHVSMPRQKGQHTVDPNDKINIDQLNEIVNYIEEVSKSGFDMDFYLPVKFICGVCKQWIVRNSRMVQDADIVDCQNPNCKASYIAHKNGEEFTFERRTFTINFPGCGHKATYDANNVLGLERDRHHIFPCPTCGYKQIVAWKLMGIRPTEESEIESKS